MFGKYFWATSLVLPFAVFGQRPFEGCQTADVCSNVKCFDPDDPEVTCDGIVMPDFDYPCKCCPVTCIKYLINKNCIRLRDVYDQEVSTCGPMGASGYRPYCDDLGDFEGKQCVSGSICYCVDKDGQRIDGEALESEAGGMDCNDSELHKTLPRDRPCTKRLKEYLETLQDPSKFCVDPEGNQIETFMGDTSTLAGQIMNCQCARSRFWASVGLGVMPTCCPNGNYMPWQCNGPVCTCVNLITGQPFGPIVEESSKNDLCCYNEDPCGIIPDFNECSSPPNLGC
ncbi:unnamed protein product [Notodromas monacha]|uniref:Thyroglobulin type-1 domain-containing protein n=1 Tax=Notodromas monacha TaxID=399045 RepID=A0A7R9GKI2_9CRUS|nr:unnamed protein product [Notodromas monacha]CAG0923938.1 unnamed protein product [Notodromas monacha]